MPYSGTTRPDHAERLRALQAALATDVFGPPDPSATAIFGVAGSLNQQLAIAQKIGIAGDAFEAAIRAPFALGYILGTAAWHADRYGVSRGPDADKVIVGATGRPTARSPIWRSLQFPPRLRVRPSSTKAWLRPLRILTP